MATKFEYFDTGADNNISAYGATWIAQTFTPSTTHKITSVKLYGVKSGSPGTLTISIRATDGSGLPTGSDLCAGTTNGDVITPIQWYEVTLGSGATLTASTKYAIVLRAPSGSVNNWMNWSGDSTSPTYAGGSLVTSADSGATWTAETGWDLYFEDWGIIENTVSSSVDMGLAPTTSRAAAVARVASHALGLAATASRAFAASRSASLTLGLNPTTAIADDVGPALCIASQSNGSIKTTSNVGTTWSTLAHDAAGAALDASWFAQYDNRLCVLNYANLGFSYSAANDVVATWTEKEQFPNLPIAFTGMFVGKDASDNPALYFLTPKGMYYLDVFTNFVFGPTEVTWEEDSTSGKKGLYWKGDTYVAVGKGIYKVSAGVVSLVGPDMDDGLPEEMQGTVTDMIGVGFWLVIAVDGGASNKSSILKRYISGKHWHPVYVSAAGSRIQALCWDSGTLYFGEGTNVKSLPFPAVTDNVNALSTQTRAATGTLTYPWFHSVFETMPKVAHKVWATTRDCNASDKVTIHYRKDEQTAWTSLGSFATSPRPTALSFGSAGVQFERIQFRATYDRGATTTNSPKVESLVLEYRVIPPTLWGWDVRVVARTQGDVKGDDILAALKTATETGTLLAFYPSGDKSKTCYYVEVKGVPGNEAGTEFGTEGIYQISLQEVVG